MAVMRGYAAGARQEKIGRDSAASEMKKRNRGGSPVERWLQESRHPLQVRPDPKLRGWSIRERQ